MNVCDAQGRSLLTCFVRGYIETEEIFEDSECRIRQTAKGIAQLLGKYGLKKWAGFCIDVNEGQA